MKKIIALILALSLCFVFCACNKDNNPEIEKVNITADAKQGVIPECKFKLGDSVKNIEETLEKELNEAPLDDHGDPEYVYDTYEMKDYNVIDNGDFKYYYLKGDNKISYIVSFTNAFGFRLGEVSLVIDEALQEYSVSVDPISKENAFFIPGMPQGEVYTYVFDNITVLFVFENNGLAATAIFDNTIWK